MATTPYFTQATFAFLKELAANNDRDWFEAHRTRYEDEVKVPALRFIQDFAPVLSRISPHFQAGPRSLFRIHRDVRFSKDKSPYKTHTGIHFRHDAGRDAHAPGFYLHVEPGACFLGLGMWRPDSAATRKVRELMMEEPDAWHAAVEDADFRAHFSLDGERLTRMPRGYAADHPMAEALRWKDFVGSAAVPDSFVTDPELPDRLGERFAGGASLVRFLCRAVGVSF